MVNIYDKANEFERALRESDEYKASLAASEEFLAKLEEVKDDKELCQKIALEESKKLLDIALKHFKGIYLITPFFRYDLTLELIDYVEENKDK